MGKAEKRLLSNPTTPIANLEPSRGEFTFSYLELCRDLHGKYWNGHRLDLVRIHKGIFGKQAYCWNGEYRQWIWEFGDDAGLLRVFVNNIQGISIEVSENLKFSRAIELFERYKKDVLR